MIDSSVAATTAAIHLLPKWNDKEVVGNAMEKRNKRTQAETNCAQFQQNATNDYRWAKYSNAMKDASLEYAEMSKTRTVGKHGFGLGAVVNKYNRDVLNSPNDRKITKTSLHRHALPGNVGKSPTKRGRHRKIPLEIGVDVDTCHACNNATSFR